MQNDLLLNMDRGHVTLLVLLDLSSALDTIDHSILLFRLQYKFGFDGLVLSWFKSYLTGRSFKVLVGDALSDTFAQEWGVPQGSCLDPLLFVLYFSKLFEITVVIFLMFKFTLMILSFTFRFLQMILMSNRIPSLLLKIA